MARLQHLRLNEPHFYISRIRAASRREGAKAQRNKGTKEQRNKGTKEQRSTDISVWSKYMKTAVSK